MTLFKLLFKVLKSSKVYILIDHKIIKYSFRNQNTIKDVHQAVVDNNLDVLKSKTEPPVPPSLITTKDSNGLTVMHKAAGLAHTRIVEYLLKVWPGGATDIDATGKTPLHWAASAKNNTRCYNLLVQAGADEEALDYVSLILIRLHSMEVRTL